MSNQFNTDYFSIGDIIDDMEVIGFTKKLQ